MVWSKDGKVLEPKKDERIKMKHADGTYLLEVVQSRVEDSGEYSVTVSNESGECAEENVEVTVTLPRREQATDDVNAEEAVTVAQHAESAAEDRAESTAAVKVPEFSQRLESVNVVEGESIVLKFSLVQGTNTEINALPNA